MANKIEYVVTARDQASGTLKKVNKEVKSMGPGFSKSAKMFISDSGKLNASIQTTSSSIGLMAGAVGGQSGGIAALFTAIASPGGAIAITIAAIGALGAAVLATVNNLEELDKAFELKSADGAVAKLSVMRQQLEDTKAEGAGFWTEVNRIRNELGILGDVLLSTAIPLVNLFADEEAAEKRNKIVEDLEKIETQEEKVFGLNQKLIDQEIQLAQKQGTRQQQLQKLNQAVVEYEASIGALSGKQGKTVEDDIAINALKLKVIELKKTRDEVQEAINIIRQGKGITAVGTKGVQDQLKLADTKKKLPGLEEIDTTVAKTEIRFTKFEQAWLDSVKSIEVSGASVFGTVFSIVDSGIDNMVSAMFDGTQSMGEAFLQMAEAILQQIATMIAKMLIFRALAGITGLPFFHDGGVVQTAHDGLLVGGGGGFGLAHDEVPIIAQTGERILSREQNEAYEAGLAFGGTAPVNVTLNVNAMDAQSFGGWLKNVKNRDAIVDTIRQAARRNKL